MFERNIDFKINNQTTLAKLIMFNRRRGDEAERITVQSIILLIETTNRAGVNPKNPYVFARSSFDSVNPIRSSDSLRKLSGECGVTKAANITSTNLRKHVASVSQILNLEEKLFGNHGRLSLT